MDYFKKGVLLSFAKRGTAESLEDWLQFNYLMHMDLHPTCAGEPKIEGEFSIEKLVKYTARIHSKSKAEANVLAEQLMPKAERLISEVTSLILEFTALPEYAAQMEANRRREAEARAARQFAERTASMTIEEIESIVGPVPLVKKVARI